MFYKILLFILSITYSFVFLPTHSYCQKLVYENSSVYIYQLPPKDTLQRKSEQVASWILQEIIKKGIKEILSEVAPTVISKFGGIFLSMITSIPGAGIPTEVEMAVLSNGKFTNTVQINQAFLPLIIITAGDCFNYGVVLTLEHSTGLFKWKIVERSEIVDFEELEELLQRGVLGLGESFILMLKRPLSMSKKGKYQIKINAWCDSEGRTSKILHVIEEP